MPLIGYFVPLGQAPHVQGRRDEVAKVAGGGIPIRRSGSRTGSHPRAVLGPRGWFAKEAPAAAARQGSRKAYL